MPFSQLGLHETIIHALNDKGYCTPTTIQQQAIPAILNGNDVLATAATGSGKTASFVLPLIERFRDLDSIRGKRVRALILVPTRELASQIHMNIEHYSKYCNVNSLAIFGGTDQEPQKQQLISGVDILVATPGRLLDLLSQRALYFDQLQTLILDEADRMLDMGFIADINKIIERLPEQRQSLLFSATLSEQVRSLSRTTIQDPTEIFTASDKTESPDIDQWMISVDKDKKSTLLSKLIIERQWKQGLIFIQTKHGAAKLVSQLAKRGIVAEAFHSGRSQASRIQLLEAFRNRELQFLVATGVVARGIDIEELERVINYDLPDNPEDYIHRIGRTARAGSKGEAIALVSKDDFKRLCAIESRLNKLLVRRKIEGFIVKKEVPVSKLNYVPKSRMAPQPKKLDQRRTQRNNTDNERGAKSKHLKQIKKRKPNPWNL